MFCFFFFLTSWYCDNTKRDMHDKMCVICLFSTGSASLPVQAWCDFPERWISLFVCSTCCFGRCGCVLNVSLCVSTECVCEGGEDKHIPLLRDVFEAFPNTPVNIDIKVNNDTLIKKVWPGVRHFRKEVGALSVLWGKCSHCGLWTCLFCRSQSWLWSMTENTSLFGATLATRLCRSVTRRYLMAHFLV